MHLSLLSSCFPHSKNGKYKVDGEYCEEKKLPKVNFQSRVDSALVLPLSIMVMVPLASKLSPSIIPARILFISSNSKI